MKYKIIVAYNGKNYSGFQIQNNAHTVQEVLENTLSQVMGESIKINASGRTDAGVSAIGQVCDFESTKIIDTKKIMGHANSLLTDIKLLGCSVVDDDFHSRFSAINKTYTYFFYVSKVENPIYSNFAYHVKFDIDVDKMNKACSYIVGEHDFTSFCAANTEVVDKVRVVNFAKVNLLYDNVYAFEINGNGFLYNMVRIIMGTLLDVGSGKLSIEDVSKIIECKDRNTAGKTAPAEYLLLKSVAYKDDIID